MLTGTVYFDLGVHGKAHSVFERAKGFDFLIAAGFLSSELVAGKSQHDEALVLVAPIQGFEVLVLAGKSAFRGYVYNEKHFVPVSFQGIGSTVNGFEWEIVKRIGHGNGWVELEDEMRLVS